MTIQSKHPVPGKHEVAATDAAMKRVSQIVEKEQAADALRISVEGGGCSGFSYKFDLVKDENDADDITIARDGGKILIDSMSLMYMGGSVVDFVDDLMGESFKIDNPNAVAGCGCGTSFSV
ncbi:MAG: iron-sulfur cluster insertion protein ErpA [Devosiaceae bacterium]|nr:iron-sulfur cluster insertion protein ErpA [Devosiaceae bacterium]